MQPGVIIAIQLIQLFTIGVTNGLFVDDLYSDEDQSEVKVKAQLHSPPNFAYIPVPYFIPPQLYHSWFANAAPAQVLPINNLNPLHYDPNGNPVHLTDSSAAAAQVVDTTGTKIIPRGSRLTRQAAERNKATKTETTTEDNKDIKAQADTVLVPAPPNQLINGTGDGGGGGNTGANAAEATSFLPEEINNIALASSSSSTTTEESVNLVSFEVGGTEWEDLNNNTSSAPTSPNDIDTENIKFNQTSSTSSYYRRISQLYDPDKVSLTTWYPDSQKLQAPPTTVNTALIVLPFRPSQEYNENTLFRPLVGPTGQIPYQQGLEPPMLPNYTYQ